MLVSVTAGDVMQRPVITAAPDESIGTVAARLADNDVGSIVVVSENRPVGIVTQSTILDCYRADRDLETTVEDVMATPVHTIDLDATIGEYTGIEVSHQFVVVAEACQLKPCPVNRRVLSEIDSELVHYPSSPTREFDWR